MTDTTRKNLADAIRMLSVDAVQKANSGHPGAPMGMADIAEVLWNDFLQHNPANPEWPNRDRFVLSNGHSSMLLYSLLHLSGYDLPLEEIKNFRQLHSRTPGHPEYGLTAGVETTTGPLGQGLANAVGMAIGEQALAARYNTEEFQVVDHFTYVFVGDGCLMEGISHEACSLAGTLGLGKLIVVWDDNGISIDGKVDAWFADDTAVRFDAYGWQVIRDVDGHDPKAIADAIVNAKKTSDRPSFICCRTIIGKGAPNKQGTEKCHGSPLGEEEIGLLRKGLDWPYAEFEIPQDIRDRWDARAKGTQIESDWQARFDQYAEQHAEKAEELRRRWRGEMPDEWQQTITQLVAAADTKKAKLATRKASLVALNELAPVLPELIGGSADLAGSNYTIWEGSKPFSADNRDANYIYFGVREFAMAAVSNGLAIYGGFRAYTGTFLVFSDYMRNAMRMSALMRLPVIYILTHDSIGLGEDGPTHQPVEQIASLRLIPNLDLWRPCDEVESMIAWKMACESNNSPTALVMSRQGLPHQERTSAQIKAIEKGAYVLHDAGSIDIILLATGSEVALATDAAEKAAADGIGVRVVSMPSLFHFEKQSQSYRDSVLPPEVSKRLAIEAGVGDSWHKYVGLEGKTISMRSFGESAPADQLFEHFGFQSENVVAEITRMLS